MSNAVNGDQPQSKFLAHVTSYPVVNDSIETFKQNPYGKKSLEIAGDAYQRFGKPVEGYLETPYSYAKPYVTKADEIADSSLGHVEQRFPIVKENTDTVIDTAKGYVFWPLHAANDGKNYLFKTWNDEYSKTASHNDRGAGITTTIMAIISTELKIASDFFQSIADFLGPKYEESKKKGAEYVKQAQNEVEQFRDHPQDKLAEYQRLGQDKIHEYQNYGQEKLDQVKGQAQQTKENAKGQAQQTKEQAKETANQTKEEAQKTKDEAQRKAGQK